MNKLDDLAMLELYLNWYKNKKYFQVSFANYLVETDKILKEYENNIDKVFTDGQ